MHEVLREQSSLIASLICRGTIASPRLSTHRDSASSLFDGHHACHAAMVMTPRSRTQADAHTHRDAVNSLIPLLPLLLRQLERSRDHSTHALPRDKLRLHTILPWS
eukprot:2724279-Rhodomonas_salina.1